MLSCSQKRASSSVLGRAPKTCCCQSRTSFYSLYACMIPSAVMKVTEDEMKAARIDIAFRDYCAHLLIPLNQCRRSTFYMPFKCSEERHAYEKCQYHE